MKVYASDRQERRAAYCCRNLRQQYAARVIQSNGGAIDNHVLSLHQVGHIWAGTVIVTARPSSCSHATDSSQETLQSRYYIVSTIFVFSVFIKTIYKLKYVLCKYIYRP